jgi:ABC-type enterochelin transport system substrate-binding protein
MLAEVEKDIEQLTKKRNDAMIFGEEELARELAKQIRDKFDRAMFGSYADLLLDDEEVICQ